MKHYDKAVVLLPNTTVRLCDRTRTLLCRIHKTSFSRYKERYLNQSVLLFFKQEDISRDQVETSQSPWLLESDCYTNNCC